LGVKATLLTISSNEESRFLLFAGAACTKELLPLYYKPLPVRQAIAKRDCKTDL